MKNLLLRFFLSLCIILLSGHSQLSAHAYKASTFYSPIKNFKGSDHAISGTVQHDQALIVKASSSGTENESYKTDATAVIEYEEKESVSFKKYLESSHYFTALFYAHLSEYFSQYIKNRLSFCKQFSYFSSFRSLYLIFRMFRI